MSKVIIKLLTVTVSQNANKGLNIYSIICYTIFVTMNALLNILHLHCLETQIQHFINILYIPNMKEDGDY